ncbi:MAG: hypothetical protein PHX62_04650 [Bacilli bacterium]|nr:hypothetical protein [Bacilli bacterium]
MNVKSQATIAYAYALGNLKIKSITTSNVVSTEVRAVDLLAKKIANTDYFKPGDVITYNIIITNPGNSKATKVNICDDIQFQSFVKDSFRYLFLNDNQADIKVNLKDHNLVFEIQELNPHEVCVLTYQTIVDQIEEICHDLRNSSSVQSKEVQSFTTNPVDIKQRYALIDCKKKALDHVFLNSNIEYEIILKNKGNVEAIDLEIVDQLPTTFELDDTPDAITLNGKNVDIYVFDKTDHTLKLIIDKVEPYEKFKIIVKGKITK